MEIKDMTAVQLLPRSKKERSPYRTLWKRPLRQSERLRMRFTPSFLWMKRVREHAQQKCRRKLTQESSPVRWPAFRSRSRTTSVRRVLRRRVRQRSCRISFRRTMRRLLHGLKRREPLSLERRTWMSLRWEVRQRLPHSALPETPGIRSMYRVDLPAVPARLWQREKR